MDEPAKTTGRQGKAGPQTRQERSRTFLTTVLPAVVLVVTTAIVAYQFVGPAPPRLLTIATGPESGAYHRFASRYQEFFARHGIQLELRSTAGSVENLELLATDENVDLAFVQSGLEGDDPKGILSLASLYYEPLWLFLRSELKVTQIHQLAGKRTAVGEAGSGSRDLVLKLLVANGIDATQPHLLAIGGSEAARGLLDGSIDAAFFVASPESPVVAELLESDKLRLMPASRAEAYARRYRFLSQILLPEGAIDLERDIPSADVPLIAAAATLLAREDTHSALIDLTMQAIAAEHGGGGVFEEPDEFPSKRFLSFPLSEDAKRFFKSGPPFLQRYMTFWAATLIARLKVLLLPLLVLIIPLFKLFPPIYRWRVRVRIYRWYRRLQELDKRIHGDDVGAQADEITKELLQIENEVSHVTVPLSYSEELYNLRMHIALVRNDIAGLTDD